MNLKLVASTRILKNVGNFEIPLWRVADGNDYVVAYFDHEPTFQEIGGHINEFIHMLEGKLSDDIKEIYSGFELYGAENMTHYEHFQLQATANVDFPAIDLTKVDVTDEMHGIKGV